MRLRRVGLGILIMGLTVWAVSHLLTPAARGQRDGEGDKKGDKKPPPPRDGFGGDNDKPPPKGKGGRFQIVSSQTAVVLFDFETGQSWALVRSGFGVSDEYAWVPVKKFASEEDYRRWQAEQREKMFRPPFDKGFPKDFGKDFPFPDKGDFPRDKKADAPPKDRPFKDKKADGPPKDRPFKDKKDA